ncbi:MULTISPECIES: HAD-IA family hydrolase [unclassified Actinomyces]|uniref:HAD-IA family hydrolase n=1 Tax=unclassified Actinomyces TaxID=2609248 RepID=UPI002016DE65|nr:MULTISPECIES: HAD-IA family hydrolase [unclassified Actinomyces]MCL3776881.1 HAD-IA family hydrolase [Actinomyces sp. AC-20-1]MCL3790792.1 HAD-IA family hydrolase [Actinomyces sp. 187325]MCL3792248.1 HAD-IA family hydrolase [Actinomyces sp. 186855]MCL3795293.1 HAD-IA family hydrolase [Actinomyces sp. 217892]
MTESATPHSPAAAEGRPPAPPAARPPAPAAIPPVGTGAVRAVLLDADGVLQLIGTPWRQALAEAGGPEFADCLLTEEHPALEGRERLADLLDRLVERLGLEVGTDDLMRVWRRATPDPAARQLVADLRAAGYLTVLATNQHEERMGWMRSQLRYDGLCDLDAYSCTLGVAKPDPRYFETVLRLAGVSAHEALFVDDSAENIASARGVGLRVLHHPVDAGGQVLRRGVVEALSRPS